MKSPHWQYVMASNGISVTDEYSRAIDADSAKRRLSLRLIDKLHEAQVTTLESPMFVCALVGPTESTVVDFGVNTESLQQALDWRTTPVKRVDDSDVT